MKLKICGMRDAQNIAQIAPLQPDYMGFIFYDRSPRFAGNLDPAALNILSPHTQRVGVFVDAPADYIAQQAERYQLHLLQLHGSETPDTCAHLSRHHHVVKAFGIQTADDFLATQPYQGSCGHFLFDTKTALHGGSGQQFDHRLLQHYCGATPFFLSGGIALEDAANIARIPLPLCHAVDINSRFETSPGIKDPALIRQFITALTP